MDIDARPASVALGGGPKMNLLSYGGRVPGGLVRARRGDTLVVHFTNALPEPTTLHWHGLRAPDRSRRQRRRPGARAPGRQA